MFYDKIAFVEILNPDGAAANSEGYIAFSGFAGPYGIKTSAVRINVQPAGVDQSMLMDGVIGKTFTGFTPASGVAEGMRLTISGTSDRYMVRGRQNYNYDPLPHQELDLFKREPA